MMLRPLLPTRKATSVRTSCIRLLGAELKPQPLEFYEKQMRKSPTGQNGSKFTAPLLTSESARKIAEVLQIVSTRYQIEWSNRRYVHARLCNANGGNRARAQQHGGHSYEGQRARVAA